MPPKSSNKKSQASWFTCDKCQISITSKDRDNHEKNCLTNENEPIAIDHIKNNRLSTSNLTKKPFTVEELNEAPQKYINNLIFVSEGAMQLCDFRIGQPITIRATAKPELAPIVRCVWPIPERFLSTVFVSERDYDDYGQEYVNNVVCLEKLSSDILPAKQVNLYFINGQEIEKSALPDIKLLLKKQMMDLVYTKANRIILKFYNKRLELVIRSCTTLIESDSLEYAFEKLQIDEVFYTVTNSTTIELEQVGDDASNDDDLQSVQVKRDDIGGLDEKIQIIEESMNMALGHLNIPPGVKISRGLLLFGPTGCGKTMICEAMATISKAHIIRINTSELFSKFLGETEKNLNQQFEIAFRNYPNPSLIIIEDVHNLCPKQENNDIIKRVSASFLSLFSSLSIRKEASRVFVLATTGNVENLNPAIRRCGRLDCEVEIFVPDPQVRLEILKCHLSKVDSDITDAGIEEIANVTHGFVGADLANLVYTASLSILKEGRTRIRLEDINTALSRVKPSAMRAVLIENPNVKWSDIGGQDELKLKLRQAIEWPLLYPEKFTQLGIKPPRGILMFGPPGCSKTMFAKALATESKVNFLSIKGPELFSMWVGESERAVREIFRKGRQVAPSIIFFDEIDAIGGERATEGGGTSVKERVLTQLLTELDGVNALKNVTIVAATNRPDMIDKALLRPGRIDRIVYVGLPDTPSRREIVQIKLRKMPLGDDVDMEELVNRTEGYSGAEIEAVCHEAALKVLEESFDSEFVSWKQFEYALNVVKPRTSPELLKLYDDYLKQS